MAIQGSFGYKIGRKVRLMHVEYNADLLWQILVREIYVLKKHYGSIELIQQAFEKLGDAKKKPKPDVIEKCKVFTDFNSLYNDDNRSHWYNITKYCQHSFINILESGYFLNNGEDLGLVFILDFNTSSVRFYEKDLDKKVSEYKKATIDEIMEFEEMPTKSLTEIVLEMRERFEKYHDKLEEIMKEIFNIKNIISKAKELGGEQNIIDKAKKLLDDMEFQKKHIETNYRFFYYRLDALNLIDHNDHNK